MVKVNILKQVENQFDLLSKSHKKIARYVLENPQKVPFMSISEMEIAIGVSAATISRFVVTIGYSSYKNFQKAFETIVGHDIIAFEEFRKSISNPSDNVLLTEINYGIDALKNLYSDDLVNRIDEVVNLVRESDYIYILASRTSMVSATYFRYLLAEFHRNVILLENKNDDISFTLQHVQKGDLLICISYSRYSRLTYNIANFFKRRGARVVAITDSNRAPIALLSDVLLCAKNSEMTYTFVATLTLINALIISIAKCNESSSIDQFNLQNEVAEELEIYLDKNKNTERGTSV